MRSKFLHSALPVILKVNQWLLFCGGYDLNDQRESAYRLMAFLCSGLLKSLVNCSVCFIINELTFVSSDRQALRVAQWEALETQEPIVLIDHSETN